MAIIIAPTYWFGTYANYSALATKDNSALYFITDTQQVFKGTQEFGQSAKFVDTLPESYVRGVVYYVNSTGVAYIHNGTAWKQIGVTTVSDITAESVKGTDVPNVTALNAALTATQTAAEGTAKTYTDTEIGKVNTALAGKVDAVAGSRLMTDTEGTKLGALPTNDELTTTLAGKVDKESGKSLVADTEITKLAALPTNAALEASLAAKANAADVYTKTQVDTAIGEASARVYRYRSTVANMAALEAITGMVVGDVYHVTSTDGVAGDAGEYVYNGEAWERLGITVDLSAYSTTEQVTAAINAAVLVETNRATSAENALSGRLDTAEGEIDGIQGALGTLTAANAVPTAIAAAQSGAEATAASNLASARTEITAEIGTAQSAAEAKAATAQAAAEAAQTTADGKIAKIASAAGSKVVISTATGEVAESGYTIGGDTIGANPTTTLATEKAVETALLNANATVNNAKMDKVTGATENNIATFNAAGNVKDSAMAIGGATLAASGNEGLVATEAAVIEALNRMAWREIPAATPAE